MTSIQALMDSSGVRFGTSGVRGLVSAMAPQLCFAYTLAFLKVTSPNASASLAIGIDLRPSSRDIAASCAAAARYAGFNVEYCGVIPTPALAYYAQEQHMLGMMVTGSHIPFDRNGIKFYGLNGEVTKADEAAISAADISMPAAIGAFELPELNPAAGQDYVARYLEFFPPACLSGMRLALYEHSSAARDLLRDLLESLGAEVISVGRTDQFVPIDTEAVSEADAQMARRWAGEIGFDAILSTDGDADRPLIGDENGDWLRGDIVGTLCARFLEAQAIAAPVSCNTVIESSALFSDVTRTRIGSPYVIAAMQAMLTAGKQHVVGFEANGGFLLGSTIYNNDRLLKPLMTRDAVLPMLSLLVMAKALACPLSQLLKLLPARYTASDRLQDFPIQTSQSIIADDGAIAALLNDLCGSAKSLDQTDGLRMTFENEDIVHLRPSGNAPELRCYVEAESQERANQVVSECLRRIKALQSSV